MGNLITYNAEDAHANFKLLSKLAGMADFHIVAGADKARNAKPSRKGWDFKEWADGDSTELDDETYEKQRDKVADKRWGLGQTIQSIDEGGAVGVNRYPLVEFAFMPSNIICLDLDAKKGADGGKLPIELNEAWQGYFKGALIERSSSGAGLHVFFSVPMSFAEGLKLNRRTHDGGDFKLEPDVLPDLEGMENLAGIGLFAGGINRCLKLTCQAVNDWKGADNIELCPEGVAMLGEALRRKDESAGGRSDGIAGGKTAGGGCPMSDVVRRAAAELGEGMTDAEEVRRAIRQNSYHNGVQGFYTALMDGDAELINKAFGGDFSTADYALAREATYYTRRYEAVLNLMLNSRLTKRGEGYKGDNPDKWNREDYRRLTIEKALSSRLESGQTYQNKQAGAGGAIIEGLPEDAAESLSRNRNGAITAGISNLKIILSKHRDYKGMFGWDDLTDCPAVINTPSWSNGRGIKAGAWSKTGTVTEAIKARFADMGLNAGMENICTAITEVCRVNPTNILREKLQSLKWDGIPRLEKMAERYFPLDKDYTDTERECANQMMAKMLVGAVRRACMPFESDGVKHDSMIVIAGDSGAGKSVAVSIIGSVCGADYFTTVRNVIRDDGRDFLIGLQGRWIAELPELAGFLNERTDTEMLKAVLTEKTDTYRELYQGRTSRFKRLTTFWGTYNPKANSGVIYDKTLFRRMWFVDLAQGEKVDLDSLKQDIEQLWAEAVVLEQKGYTNYFDDGEMEKTAKGMTARYYVENPLEDYLEELLNNPVDELYKLVRKGDGWFTLQQFWEKLGDKQDRIPNLTNKRGYRGNMRIITEVLLNLGYKQERRRTANNTSKTYFKKPLEEWEKIPGGLRVPYDENKKAYDNRVATSIPTHRIG
ncbi:TPA: virulence-associated E family protein [Neisseria lactamica]|uniref:virulence-associated E family protein n=1 Tax=Neisseria lactamica TaxID=486 RepID=UPI001EFCD035|nr:virulence-associated E family protein [Neisseria lactamica]